MDMKSVSDGGSGRKWQTLEGYMSTQKVGDYLPFKYIGKGGMKMGLSNGKDRL